MKITFFLLAILLCAAFASAQITISPDTTAGKYKIRTVNIIAGLGTQVIETEALDSTQMRERILNTAISTHEAIEKMKNDLRALEKQAADLRGHYGRFDPKGYYGKAGEIYSQNFTGKYGSVECDSLGAEIKGSKKIVDIAADATGKITIKQGNNTGVVSITSANSITVSDFYKVKPADKTYTAVSFFRVNTGRYEGVLGNRTVKLSRK
jgi:hypothetical protein